MESLRRSKLNSNLLIAKPVGIHSTLLHANEDRNKCLLTSLYISISIINPIERLEVYLY